MRRSDAALIVLSVVASVIANGCSGVRPANLGLKDGRLAPCPDTPNCVSSQSADKGHFVDPLPFAADVAMSMKRLKTIILGMQRAAIVAETETYLHAEYTSALWRFVDDVEFSVDGTAKQVHVRSASRLGRSDLGVNRRRVEAIRTRWREITGPIPAPEKPQDPKPLR